MYSKGFPATIALCLGLGSQALLADIALVYKDDTVAVAYREDDRVIFKRCQGQPLAPVDRRCAGAGNSFETSYAQYAAHAHMLYKVGAPYQDETGLVRVSQKIEQIRRDLSSGNLPPANQSRAEALLAELSGVQRRLLEAKRDLLDNLPADRSATLDVSYNDTFYRALYAFHTLWYDGDGRVWRLGSQSAMWDKQTTVCTSPWRPAGLGDYNAEGGTGVPIRERLHETPVGGGVGIGFSTWTPADTHPGHNSRRWSIHDPRMGQVVRIGPISTAEKDAAKNRWIAAGEKLYFDYEFNTGSHAIFCVWQ